VIPARESYLPAIFAWVATDITATRNCWPARIVTFKHAVRDTSGKVPEPLAIGPTRSVGTAFSHNADYGFGYDEAGDGGDAAAAAFAAAAFAAASAAAFFFASAAAAASARFLSTAAASTG
jgi:hypothetical protein